MAPKIDPKLLEREFVTGGVSVRELARRYSMSWSAIATRARKEDEKGMTWYDKKAAFESSVAEKSFDKTVEKFADEESTIREELILVHRATIHTYAQQLREGKIAVTPKDAAGATSALLLLLGGATSRTETTIDISNTIKPDELRRMAEWARAKLIDGTATAVPEPGSEGARQN
jgi:transposase